MTSAEPGSTIPILMYHNIGSAPPRAGLPSLYVGLADFARQMRTLRLLGFRGVSMSQALPFLRGERRGRVAVLTFDDGYADNLQNALPVLTHLGFRATCYVATAAIGGHNIWDAERLNVRKPIMGADELRQWHAAGMEIGAHTRTHPHLTGLPAPGIDAEVLGSKKDLEDRLGIGVSQFCYPYGDYDARALDAVRRAGFAAATTMRRGRARAGDDPFQLRRILVRGTEGLQKFLLKLLTPYEDHRGRGQPPLQTAAAP